MCHVSEFQKILDSNYARIALSIHVKFSLGKWLGTRQKIIKITHKKIKITPAVECVQEYQHDLSIKQYKYVYISWVSMSWPANNIPILPF